MKSNTLLQSFTHALVTFLYVCGVAWILFNGEELFGQEESFWVPFILLLLFVLSAAIVAALVLGRPIMLYLAGAKSQAMRFFSYTVGWLFVMLLLVFALRPWQ